MEKSKVHSRKFHLPKLHPATWAAIIIAAVYILFGVGIGISVYKYRSENKVTKFAVKIYPLPVAWVGTTPIWAKDYYQYLSYIKQFSQKSNQALPDEKQLRNQILDQLVDLTVIKKAAKDNKITVTKKEIDDTYNKISEQNSGDKGLKEVLQEMYGMTVAQFKGLIYDQLLAGKVKSDLLMQIKVRHILIKDEARAKEVLDKVKKGDNFEDLAKQYSEDTGSKDNGGDLGWVSRGTMVKEFEDASFTLNAGQTTQDLIKSQFGFHIIRVDDKKGKIDKSFDDWFNGLKANTKIKKWIK